MNDVLIIEDDADIALSVKYALERDGDYAVRVQTDGEVGLHAAVDRPPDLLLLDLNLPGVDGMELCRQLRKHPRTEDLPIIMLTARVAEQDKLSGLDGGADDYITKPFSVREVVARVRAVLRRSRTPATDEKRIVHGPIEIDVEARVTRVEEVEVVLTRKEFDLLVRLLRSRGRVLTRERLLEEVWGYEHPGTTRTVDVHVRQLRKKLGSPTAEQIETVIGVGYRLRQAR